jgi:hypothetical protein
MTVTVLSATWANPANTRVLINTAERGTVLLHSGRPEWAKFQAWIASGGVVAPFVVPEPKRFLEKETIIERLTDDELAVFAALLTSTNAVRRRAAWRFLSAQSINAESPGLRTLLVNLFGENRMLVILA